MFQQQRDRWEIRCSLTLYRTRFAGLQPICLRREATRRRTCRTLIDRRTRPYRMRRVREAGWYFQLNVTRRRISLT